MKISNSKKQLAKIISENGGWRKTAEFSAQDFDGDVFFYHTKPSRDEGAWRHNGVLGGDWINCGKVLPNWHQTILSRDEYSHLYPAPDADGRVEWKGGECPVEKGVLVDVKWRTGTLGGLCCDEIMSWTHAGRDHDIIAYRLHKPEQSIEQKRSGVTEQNKHAHVDAHPTIEQLAADYRAKLAIAQQAQEEADSHRCGAEVALDRLYQAGLEIGLDIAIASDDSELEHELVITDWRDLRVGDVIWWCGDEYNAPGEYEVKELESDDYDGFLTIAAGNYWVHYEKDDWKFIRRP